MSIFLDYEVLWDGRGPLVPLSRHTQQGRTDDTAGDAERRVKSGRTRDTLNWTITDPRGGGRAMRVGKGAR